MKNTGLFLLLTLFTVNSLLGQNINFEEIKKNTANPNSPFFYNALVKEFETESSALRSDNKKTQHLYYGKLYSSYYKKDSETKPDYLKFIKLTSAEKYVKAIRIGEDLLEKDPVNLVVLMHLITCYKGIQEKEERRKKLEIQVEVLLTTIAQSGDGKNKETPFKVISLGDEFSLLNYLDIQLNKFTRTSENLEDNVILDIWIKDEKYTQEHRNKIYITVISANSKIQK